MYLNFDKDFGLLTFFDVYFSEIYTQIGYFVEGMRLLHHH